MCQNPAYSKLNQYPLRHMKYQGPSINSREITYQRIYERIEFLIQNFPRNQHSKIDFKLNLLFQYVNKYNLLLAQEVYKNQ